MRRFYLPEARDLIVVLCALLLFWFGGFLGFCAGMPTPGTTVAVPHDGIVVLTGTRDRLVAGFDLLRQGLGRRLLISGVNPATTKAILGQATGQDEQLLDCCVDLGRIALHTRGNATEAILWAESHGFHSLIVVTTGYHMPRSMLEFRARMPALSLTPFATRSDAVTPGGWWYRPRALFVMFSEFNKYLVSLVRVRLTDNLPEPAPS
ncbi:YdcF family protein [Oceanibacterium hippocampi]|uniref:DUF218 domain-containing protein n=1 Tax=Oceanibacterium hippocampi TaxID=745714 RepID=A0A1Y5RW50_9PROT|nr:YdcF family protein [Oceanibacterium hippocampi]SLN26451.1 hypothetical protein OCH7691_00818 [Oceanibacterium hippocampi]